MNKNYRNKYTGRQVEAHFYVKGVKRLIDEMFRNSGVEWQFYSDENVYEFEQNDEYGFSSTQALMLGDYIVWDGDYFKVYTPQRFADVYQIIHVGGIPEVLTGVEEPEHEPERHSEGFRKWVGATQHPGKQSAPSPKISGNKIAKETDTPTPKFFWDENSKKDWYTTDNWWINPDRSWDKFEEASEQIKPYVDPCIETLDAYRITTDFDEWNFAEWLTPGDKFTLTNSISVGDKDYPEYTNPVVTIYSPKTEGQARTGDLIIRVCPHRYVIQACVPEQKHAD